MGEAMREVELGTERAIVDTVQQQQQQGEGTR